MRDLTLDDLLPLDEYADRRREFFESHGRYLDRYRRVRVGPRATLVFENRQTLWFRLQEVLCIARLQQPTLVQRELDLYNRLLPSQNCLQAALLIAVEEKAPLSQELAPWRHLQGDQLRLHLGDVAIPANLFTCRPEDLTIGTAHWVQFKIDPANRARLADLCQPVYFSLHLASYRHESSSLSDDIRQSLLDDLNLSDRDAA